MKNSNWMDKPSPQAIEAERAVLGGILVDPTWLSRVELELQPSDFYRPEHGALLRLFSFMSGKRVAIDLVTVGQYVAARPDLYGGPAYVAELPESAVSTANLAHYVELVRAAATARGLIATCMDVANEAFNGQRPVDELVDVLGQKLSAMHRAARRERHTMSGAELVDQLSEYWLDRDAGAVAPPLTSGIDALDVPLNGGFQPGQLVCIAGIPGMGKTSLAMGAAVKWARAGRGVLFASLEMPKKFSIFARAIAAATGIPAPQVESGNLDPDERDFVLQLGRELGPLHFYDRPGSTLAHIEAEARRLYAMGELQAVVVDYVGLIRPPPGDRSNRSQQLGQMTKGLKQLALELKCPVVVLSQLLEKQIAKREAPAKQPAGAPSRRWYEDVVLPTRADIRDSGEIVEDADILLFPVNASRYGFTGHMEKVGAIVVAKNKNGPTDIIPCGWDGPATRYHDFNNGSEAKVLPMFGDEDAF